MELIPFPGSESPSLRLEARAKWNGRLLDLEFSLSHPQLVASLTNLPVSDERRDELWKTTCFECFLTTEKMKPAYYEINLSPGGDWAFYGFTSYRQGMKKSDLSAAPLKTSSQEKATWSYRLDLSDQNSLKNETLLVSLCAVIESREGAVSYWSLVHRQSKPDFHHLEHFVHVLSPKE
ncbi:MAG TPA: DOMON-like domain-containing protein [Pseudobdellovibrionaceae bacterium]|nr:DOMON-like domain-containing protein [Pseudobdellovibrionaceae bacterium]